MVCTNAGEPRVLWWSCIYLLLYLYLYLYLCLYLYLFMYLLSLLRWDLLAVAQVELKYPPVAMQKKVCLYLYEAVIKWAQENVCAELLQALVLQLVLIRTDLTQQKMCCLASWHSSPLDCFISAQINLILYNGCCRFMLLCVCGNALHPLQFLVWWSVLKQPGLGGPREIEEQRKG